MHWEAQIHACETIGLPLDKIKRALQTLKHANFIIRIEKYIQGMIHELRHSNIEFSTPSPLCYAKRGVGNVTLMLV